MEKRLKRIEIFTVIILVLSVWNLIPASLLDEFKTSNSEIKDNKELPKDLTRDTLNKIVYSVKTNYNTNDWNNLYSIFGEYAKAQLSAEKISYEFEKLKPVTGNIATYAYSHYMYEGNSEKAEWFEAIYKCRFANGKGTIKISTRTVDGKSEIVGIVINIDEI